MDVGRWSNQPALFCVVCCVLCVGLDVFPSSSRVLTSFFVAGNRAIDVVSTKPREKQHARPTREAQMEFDGCGKRSVKNSARNLVADDCAQ